MIFSKSTLFLCLAAASATADAEPVVRVLKSAKTLKADKTTKKAPKASKKSATPPDDGCISVADMEQTIGAFARTPPAVTAAFRLDGCTGAYLEALGALQAAYAYNFGPVLFKPTISSVPYTQRNTLAGALSYFIGTECLKEVNSMDCDGPCVFPDGNENGDIFRENGFGQYIPYGHTNNMEYSFNFLEGGAFCESSIAIGQICWDRIDGEPRTTCVDKTFSFKKGDTSMGQLPAVITSHHSSSVVVLANSTQTTCQNAPCEDTGAYDTSICPPVDACV